MSERPAQVEERILTAMLRVIAATVVFNGQVADRLKMGVSDMQFLTYLQLHGPLTPGRLSTLSGLRSGTVTGVVDRLERAGLVRRRRDDADRRKVLVELDEERVARDVHPLYAAQGENLFTVLQTFRPEQLETIAEFLERMAADAPQALP